MKRLFYAVLLALLSFTGAMAQTYTVAGSAAILNGTASWDPTNTENDMVAVEDGVWQLVVENCQLEADNYEYKVVEDHAWTVSYPADNAVLTITETALYTVTFTLEDTGQGIDVSAEAVKTGDWAPSGAVTLTVAGSSKALFGSEWDPTDTNNDMTLVGDNIYELKKLGVELGEGSIQYKVAKDHDWGSAWPSQDASLNVPENGIFDVTFSFNYATKEVNAEVTAIEEPIEEPVVIETMSIVGELTGGWPDGEDWSMAKPMLQDADNANTWSLTLEGVALEAGSYKYKAVANNKWGDYELPASGDQICEITEAGTYNLTFTADTENHKLTLVTDKQAVVTFTDLLTLEGKADYTEGKAFMIEAESGSATIKVTSGETVLTEIMEDGVAMVEITGNAFTEGEFVISADKELTLTKVSLLDNPDAADGVQIWPAIEEPVVIETMSIVGELTGGWPTDTDWSMAKAMTQDPDNANLWTLTLENVELEAKTYQYKATANGKWGDYELPASGNNECTIAEAGTYTLTFTADTEAHTLNVLAEKQAVTTFVDLLTLEGKADYTEGKAFMIEAESGSATIKVTSGETVLTEIMEDGVAMVEITGNAFTEGEFVISADKELTLTKVSLLDNPDAADGVQIWPAIEEPVVIETMSIVGELTGGWPTDTDWSMAKAMTQDPDNANLWTLTLENVELEAKTYQYKATANGKWGDYELPASGNNECTIAEAGTYTLTFTADTEAHTLNVLAEKQAVTTFVDLLTLEGKADYTEGKAFMIEAESGSATIKVTSGETVLTEIMEDGVAMVEITGNAFTEGEFVISADKELTLTKVSLLDNPDAADGVQIWPAIEEPVVIETMSIVGTFPGMSWDAAEGIAMTKDPDNANLWTLTLEGVVVEGQKYEYKAIANGKYGEYELPAEGNKDWVFGTDEYPAGTYNLTFTADTEKHDLSILVDKQVVATFTDLLTLEGKADYTEGKAFMIEAESGSATIKVTSGETVLTEIMEDGVAMVEITGNAFTEGEFVISADKELTLTKVSLLDNPDAADGVQIWPAIEEPVVIETMSIVGTFPGMSWDAAEGIAMTKDPDNANLWTLTLEGVVVEGQKYEYKAIANGKYGEYELPAEGNKDWVFGTDEYPAGTYNLTFTADTEKHDLSILVDKQVVATFTDLLTLEGKADYTEGKAFMIEAESGSATIKVTSGETVLTEIMEDGVAMVEITGNAFTEGEFVISADKELTLTKVSLLDNPDAADGVQIWPAIEEPVVIETMSIVGTFPGMSWDAAEGIAMTKDPDNANLWTLTLEGVVVEGQKYEYKAIANGKYGEYELPAEGNKDWVFGTDEYPAGTYNLTFTADTEKHDLSILVDKQAVTTFVDLLTLEGKADYTEGKAFMIEAESGSATIKVTSGETVLTEIMEDGVAMVEITGNAFTEGEFVISADKELTLTKVSLLDNPDAADGVQIWPAIEEPVVIETMSIVGELTGGWPDGEDWSMAKAMTQDPDNANLWTLTVDEFAVSFEEGSESRTYAYKATANGKWGDYELPAEGNNTQEFTEEGNYKLVFTADTELHTLTLEATRLETPVENAVIATVELRGAFNSWSAGQNMLTATDTENTYQGVLDLTDIAFDQEFKLVVNAEGGNGDIWLGGNQLTMEAPEGWIAEVSDGANFKLLNSTTGYQTYTFTATWTPSPDAAAGWMLKIEGLDEREEIKDAEITHVQICGATDEMWQNRIDFDLAPADEDNAFGGLLDLTESTDDVQFKLVVNDNNWIGTNQLTLDAPEGWVVAEGNGGNFTLTNSTTGYQTYTFTATWTPSPDPTAGWTLKIEGKDERVVEIPDAVITNVELRGQFNDWTAGTTVLEPTDVENVYEGTLDLTATKDDQEFKLVVNAEGVENDIWIGNGSDTQFDAPEGWIVGLEDGDWNYVLKNSTTGYQTYTVTATWTPSSDAGKGWTLKIEGKDERVVEIPDAVITNVELRGQFNDWTAGTTVLEPTDVENVYEGTLDLTATKDDQEFKLVVNAEGVENDIWIGNGSDTQFDAPEGWIVGLEDGDWNYVLKNSTTGYQTYTVTATWTPSSDAGKGWTLKIEGKDERVVEIPDAVITNVELRGQFNDWTAGTTVLEPTDVENVYEGTLDLTATKDDQEFKLVVNAEGVENDIWIGNGSDTQFDAPEGWIVGLEDGDWNYVLKNSTTGYQTYTVTATWTPSSDAGKGWQLTIVGKDERIATGIEAWRTEFRDGHYYNLQGVRITNPKRGVYIHNGHKVVVK